jgi:hypothetical protein
MCIRVDEGGPTERRPADEATSVCADDKDLPPGGTHSDDDSDPVAPSFRWAIINPVRNDDEDDDAGRALDHVVAMGPWKASTREEEAAAAAKNPASAIRSFMVRLLLVVLRRIGIGDR